MQLSPERRLQLLFMEQSKVDEVKDRQSEVCKDGGSEMRDALQISIAIWGMLACALLGLAQYFDFLF
jgi:hypothetical protein